MENFEKSQIANLANQRKTAHTLGNKEVAQQSKISATNISFMLSEHEEWKNRIISDDMWEKLAEWAGFYKSKEESWKFVPTNTTNKILRICQSAQSEGIAVGICGPAGAGKSGALKHYLFSQPKNTYYLECRASWRQSTFLRKIMQALGISPKGFNIHEMEEAIIDYLNNRKTPLFILDEIQELPEGSFRVLKTIFNGTEFNCGFIYCGGLNFERRMRNGLQYCKTSYEEIYSRMGGEIIKVSHPTKNEVKKICTSNNAPKERLDEIVNQTYKDLRLARRKVMQMRLMMQAG